MHPIFEPFSTCTFKYKIQNTKKVSNFSRIKLTHVNLEIIDRHKNIFLPSNTLYLSGANQIHMNKFKRFRGCNLLNFLMSELNFFSQLVWSITQLVIFSSFEVPRMSSKFESLERSLKFT